MDDRNRSLDDASAGDVQRDVPVDRDPNKASVGGRLVGEGVGGAGGIAAGAAIGSLAGPVGTVIGMLAGAVGGWWAGKEVADAVSRHDDDADNYYRTHYEQNRRADTARSYDDVRPVYQLGDVAARNPDYQGRRFEEIEPDLQRGWTDDLRTRHGDWSEVRGYASEGYTRGRGAVGTAAQGARNLADRAGDATERGMNRAANAADDIKDRFDADPVSRPGADPTDRRV